MFIDTNVFLYTLGADHPMRDGSTALIVALGEGELDGVTNAEVLQELLHVLSRRSRMASASQLVLHVTRLVDVLAVDLETMRDAARLLGSDLGLGSREAVHVASMRRAGIHEIVSADRGFDRVPGVVRRSPDEFA